MNTFSGAENTGGGYTVVNGATLTNMKDVLILAGVGWGPGWTSPLPYVYFNGTTVLRHWELWMSGNQVKANLKGGGSTITMRYIVYYTKTTD